jgi:hypothetical protein
MEQKQKTILIAACVILGTILLGIILSPYFLNWGLENSLPIYTKGDMDKPLRYNQYILSGEFLHTDGQHVYILVEGIVTEIHIINYKEDTNYKICNHTEGGHEKIKYAVYAEQTGDNYNIFTLRRELC